jgi:hypothetical protein
MDVSIRNTDCAFTYEDLGCKTINLSQYLSSPVRLGPYTFSSSEIVEVGETFRVYVSLI